MRNTIQHVDKWQAAPAAYPSLEQAPFGEQLPSVPDPAALFARDGRINRRTELNDGRTMATIEQGSNIVQGLAYDESGAHSLRAVVHAAGRNYAIVEAPVNGRLVHYLTAMATDTHPRQYLGLVTDKGPLKLVRPGTETSAHPDTFLSATVDPGNGSLHIRGGTMGEVSVGAGAPERPTPKRFTVRSALAGLKRFLLSEPGSSRPILPGNSLDMTGKIDSWKAPEAEVAFYEEAFRELHGAAPPAADPSFRLSRAGRK